VGVVSACLHDDGSVTVENVPSHRYRASVAVDVPGYGRFVGDIAWGGNWFFLIGEHSFDLAANNCPELLAATTAIRNALRLQGITGEDGQEIDHIEFFSSPVDKANSSRNFVLCPGAAFDRSPCGTGTSAKMACLHADGKLKPGDSWRQEGILGTVFLGSITESEGGEVVPSIRAQAWITAECTLHFRPDDPFARGIRF
jgi:4-hydroxyproline epimerase